MKKRAILISLLAGLLVASYALGRFSNSTVQAQGHASIQGSFGHCVGGFVSPTANVPLLIFEDRTGVVRLVDTRTGNAATVYDRLAY
jgi:membrane-bound metal-dependent hydrolase YbcI (DUF457 family)